MHNIADFSREISQPLLPLVNNIDEKWNSLDSTYKNVSISSLISRSKDDDDSLALLSTSKSSAEMTTPDGLAPKRPAALSTKKRDAMMTRSFSMDQVFVFGTGLKRAYVGEQARFYVEAHGLYKTDVEIVIEGVKWIFFLS